MTNKYRSNFKVIISKSLILGLFCVAILTSCSSKKIEFGIPPIDTKTVWKSNENGKIEKFTIVFEQNVIDGLPAYGWKNLDRNSPWPG